MTDTKQIHDLLEAMVKGFTRWHDDLEIKTHETDQSVTFSIASHADDTGKIIGVSGVMVKALQLVLDEMGNAIQKRVRLIVCEPSCGQKMAQDPFSFDSKYQVKPQRDLLERVAHACSNDGASVHVTHHGPEITVLVLTLDTEYGRKDSALERALSTIFNAIGKSHGANLFVDLNPKARAV